MLIMLIVSELDVVTLPVTKSLLFCKETSSLAASSLKSINCFLFPKNLLDLKEPPKVESKSCISDL